MPMPKGLGWLVLIVGLVVGYLVLGGLVGGNQVVGGGVGLVVAYLVDMFVPALHAA